ncbi:hypothetical protein [Salipaludibacillus sp. CF4.18]|uniref:hypothetical protein n=1 Tax=Salipaludibacillus sp. CF4.18 TaxID=3373081 RepID=UPI003EE7BBA7
MNSWTTIAESEYIEAVFEEAQELISKGYPVDSVRVVETVDVGLGEVDEYPAEDFRKLLNELKKISEHNLMQTFK